MSFADTFTADDALLMAAELGDPTRLTWGVDNDIILNLLPRPDAHAEEGDDYRFANLQTVIEIHEAQLPDGSTPRDLKPNGTVQRLGRDARPLKVSDVRSLGLGLWALVCEP